MFRHAALDDDGSNRSMVTRGDVSRGEHNIGRGACATEDSEWQTWP
jgi:hypothetical protein